MDTITDTARPRKRISGVRQVLPHPNPVLAAEGLSATFHERFWKKVNKTASCWLWTGCTSSPCPYGTIGKGRAGAGNIAAHVASWIIHNGPIPNGMCVLHNCPGGDNPSCVNPKHLWLGTHTENMRDMALKGHSAIAEIARKLTDDQVAEIRQRYHLKNNLAQIGRKFGVSRMTIHRVLTRQTYTHL